ncbi:hypothetical protein PPYR_12795 [Photinus pyralis]|uniref:Uncharacterized protein n=3 Tax=Photinus pyralis TaxID=7054 RepID=A0A5N4A791_PHOPY|nr:hypothetical protein PPYR_12795 [Photinus pyralis]
MGQIFMAYSCLQQCNPKTFSKKEIDHLSDRMKNVLESAEARNIFNKYLHEVRRGDLLKVLVLWCKADLHLRESQVMSDSFEDLIDEIDDFNTMPFLSINENNFKLLYVKQECCRILSKILNNFVKYLEKYHMH